MYAKGDAPHIRYLFDRRTHLAYRRLMKTLNNSLAFESNSLAQFRLKAIEFYYDYGLQPTLKAYNLKSSTLYDWIHAYEASGKKLISLVPRSTRPRSLRRMEVDWRLIVFVESTRKKYGNVGARIIKPFVDEYAALLKIPSIGRTTIEKVIRRHKLTFEARTKAKRKTRNHGLVTRKSPRVTTPGYIEVDTIEIRIFQKKYYFISIIDIYTRYAYVELIKSKASVYATASLVEFQHQYQQSIHTVQTDNGSEFMKSFHLYLEEQNITHIFTYPNSPKLNGVVERFNRTVQEEFINRSDDFGVDDDRFTRKLISYLKWYNYKRPHSSLGYQSPMSYMNS